MNSIYSLSPLDGRYADKADDLRSYLSEYGLIYYRVLVENTVVKTFEHYC